MIKPIYVREITAEENNELKAGLRSPDPYTMRRSQIILASARGERALRIAEFLGCHDQTVRNAIKAFNREGISAIRMGSRRPKTVQPIFNAERLAQLKGLLHRSPREFGKATSLWTLALAAEVCFAEGVTPQLVSDDCIRNAMQRMGIGWKRAKQWITSPDPGYARKKTHATA